MEEIRVLHGENRCLVDELFKALITSNCTSEEVKSGDTTSFQLPEISDGWMLDESGGSLRSKLVNGGGVRR